MRTEDGKFGAGNPGGPGRPKQKPFIDWCKTWTKEKAEKFLTPIAEDVGSKNQLEAIKLIMAYAVGKPVDFVESTNFHEGLGADAQQSKAELDEIISRATGSGLPSSVGDGASQGQGTA